MPKIALSALRVRALLNEARKAVRSQLPCPRHRENVRHDLTITTPTGKLVTERWIVLGVDRVAAHIRQVLIERKRPMCSWEIVNTLHSLRYLLRGHDQQRYLVSFLERRRDLFAGSDSRGGYWPADLRRDEHRSAETIQAPSWPEVKRKLAEVECFVRRRSQAARDYTLRLTINGEDWVLLNRQDAIVCMKYLMRVVGRPLKRDEILFMMGARRIAFHSTSAKSAFHNMIYSTNFFINLYGKGYWPSGVPCLRSGYDGGTPSLEGWLDPPR